MQRSEFENLTGIRPTLSMYSAIEKEYMASEKGKVEFCHDYGLNVDGIAEKIQRLADMEEISRQQKLEDRIAELQKQLDKKQMNVPKKRVLELALATLEREIWDKCGRIRNYSKMGLDFSFELVKLEPLLEEWKTIKNEYAEIKNGRK